MKYDILLKGGTVIDPAQKLHDRRDVAVIDEKLQQSRMIFPKGGDANGFR